VTGGPKATRLRRVLSVSDGVVEVGWVPVHSVPEVRDNPLLMLQTLKSDGRASYRICFTESEARELLASLAWVLGYEIVSEMVGLHGHCGTRSCRRGSSAGSRSTAISMPETFRPSGCECTCSLCSEAVEREVDKTCDHPAEAEVKRLEYGVVVERRCGTCGSKLEVVVNVPPPRAENEQK
jgi:hypothetical protein